MRWPMESRVSFPKPAPAPPKTRFRIYNWNCCLAGRAPKSEETPGKFLLTAARLKDGTNRDEPRRTGPAGLAEASARPEDDAAGGGRANGSQRALGAEAVAADERGG